MNLNDVKANERHRHKRPDRYQSNFYEMAKIGKSTKKETGLVFAEGGGGMPSSRGAANGHVILLVSQ